MTPRYKIGAHVIVTLCSGEYEGIVSRYRPANAFGPPEGIAYEVRGPNVLTTVTEGHLEPFTARKLKRASMCTECTVHNCEFKETKK